MTIYERWDDKDPDDIINPGVLDFTNLLPEGATLTGTPEVVSVPPGLLIGAAALDPTNLLVLVQVAGGVLNTIYQVRVSVADTAGNYWNRSTNPFRVRSL